MFPLLKGRKASHSIQWGVGDGAIIIFFPPAEALHFRQLKGSHTHLAKPMKSFWIGTFWSSGHHAKVSTWWVCHLTHSWGSSKDSLGIEDLSDSSSPLLGNFVSDRNFCTCGSSSRGCPKSSGSSAQDCGWEPVAYRLNVPPVVGRGACFTFVSLLWLESSKVTCLWGLMRLGETAHLFAGSPVWSAAGGTCSPWLASRHLLQLLVHLLLHECCWLSNCPQLPCHPWKMEWLSCSICPSSIAAAASTWQWASLATLRALSCDSCCLFWKWPKWS